MIFRILLTQLKFVLLALGLWQGTMLHGQYSGTLLNASENTPLYPASVSVVGSDVQVLTDSEGNFELDHNCVGRFFLEIQSGDLRDKIEVSCSVYLLGTIYFTGDTREDLDQLFTTDVVLDANDEVSPDNISGMLSASRDAFSAAAAFNWGVARFRIRGYDSRYTDVFLNGRPVNNMDNGRVIWGQWGGLNDVTRNQSTQLGLLPADFTLGSIGGSNVIDLRASSQRRQVNLVASAANRNYRFRTMATLSTGMMSNGWAISMSASHRWANEGYVPGTWYDGYGYFLSVDKKINEKHSLNALALGSPTRSGRQGPAIAEAQELADDVYYNPWWGYQNGEKRNSRVGTYHQPIFMLRHDWTPSDRWAWTTTASYQFGRGGSTALDWFNAPDPRPDYYRKLPSNYDDPTTAQQVADKFRNDETYRQIQWDLLYDANRSSEDLIQDVDGIVGNDVRGYRSNYIVSERRFDVQEMSFNTMFNHQVNDDFALQGGLMGRKYRGESYNLVDDLLGGDFFVDVDQFALFDFPDNPEAAQNDLQRPNRLVREGGQYGHHYYSHIEKARGWLQGQWSSSRWDPYAGIRIENTRFWREGLVQKGLFPNNSLGDSEKFSFLTYQAKAGAVYKIDGRNYLHIGGIYGTEAPTFRDAFLSPRTRNEAVVNLVDKIETVRGGEISYNLRSPRLKIKALAYYTEILDQISTRGFFHDDLVTFVNFSISGIDLRHQGVELSASYDVNSSINLHASAAIGEYTITSRPEAIITRDNNASRQFEGYDIDVYAKGIHVGGTPQSAYNFGIDYRSKDFWNAFLNINYFDRIFLPYNPVRRTIFAVEGLDPEGERFRDILRQEELGDQITVDLSFYKSWKVDWLQGKSSFLAVSFNVNNLLNNQGFRTGGFEQFRFDFDGQDPSRFPPAYFYLNGINYFINVNYRFY